MKSFLIWLTLHLLVWAVLTYPLFKDLDLHAWRLAGVAVYFLVFFITPLFYKKISSLTLLYCFNAAIAAIIFFPHETYEFNMPVLFVYTLLMAEAAERLPIRHMAVPYLFSFLSIMSFLIFGEIPRMSLLFIILFSVMLVTAFIYYKLKDKQHQKLLSHHEHIQNEYRRLKRRLAQDEENARQEERQMIGKEIHDSVGHKLTSLIMQLEVYRIQSNTNEQLHVERLKELANESLEETRRAVKTFKQQEIGGLQGVMRLIRKLELESFIRIHFSVHHGAFAAPLTGEQSFAIYRAVQEGLTNIMKHSQAREAQITFEAPGGSIFRFEIINPIKHALPFKEDYGLASMRERLEKLGGGLEAQRNEKQFILKGWVKLKGRGDLHDSSTSS
ncbi:Signal transduction histidine kinase [Halobacillus karajensis]|uniref:sensor histidine kinase n=1 Tax=Halobacillus karajensis TaxID=195088 RepID=UPI0008A7A61F|nr:sensor histidine kinase [Halobacillus karajensis]SEH87157.1 Signal transduction histidine kinase [Halobacillus karajensis]